MIEQLFVFLVGLLLGSFTNVLIARWKQAGAIFTEPSHCPYCHRRLAWFDLIPLVSFFLLRGRCRYCGRPISWQYPAVELAVGLLAVALLLRLGLSASLVLFLLMLPFLVALFVVDLKNMVLPDVYLFPAAVFGVGGHLLRDGFSLETLASIGIGVLATAGFLGLLYAGGKGKWMGFGDVKYGVFLGGLFGWPLSVAALLIAFFAGSLVAGVLVARGIKTMRSPVPFGPFLVLGTYLALFFKEEILFWYHRAFL